MEFYQKPPQCSAEVQLVASYNKSIITTRRPILLKMFGNGLNHGMEFVGGIKLNGNCYSKW